MRHERGGYEFVFTPHLTNGQLFEQSGTSPGTPTACTRRWRWTTARTT